MFHPSQYIIVKGGFFMNENESLNSHRLIMEDRKRIVLTGVKDILSFDEEAVSIITVMGKAVIRGKNLRIESFDNDNGDMAVEGSFDALVYLNDSPSGGVFRRLFK